MNKKQNKTKQNKKRFHILKDKKQWYHVETMTDVDYTDDLRLLENTPAQAEFLMHSLQQAAEGIGFYVDANKTKFKSFKQDGTMSTKVANLWN